MVCLDLNGKTLVFHILLDLLVPYVFFTSFFLLLQKFVILLDFLPHIIVFTYQGHNSFIIH